MSRMFKEEIFVIPAGYNLQSLDWELTVAGDLETGRLGRLPKAIHDAMSRGAHHMLWNTGASKKEWEGSEISEAAFTYRYAVKNLRAWMSAFPHHFDDFSFAEIDKFMRDESKHHFDTVSTNTLTTAYEAVPLINRIAGEKQVTIISVSSRNHERAGHHLEMVLKQGYRGHGPLKSKCVTVYHTWADTGYNNDGPIENVQIIECSGEDRYAPKLKTV